MHKAILTKNCNGTYFNLVNNQISRKKNLENLASNRHSSPTKNYGSRTFTYFQSTSIYLFFKYYFKLD